MVDMHVDDDMILQLIIVRQAIIVDDDVDEGGAD